VIRRKITLNLFDSYLGSLIKKTFLSTILRKTEILFI